jgi:hypothetical protein
LIYCSQVSLFKLSHKSLIQNTSFPGKAYIKAFCCSYGSKITKTETGFDCAKIPGASKVGGTSLAIAAYGFCGGELGTIAESVIAATVCCK